MNEYLEQMIQDLKCFFGYHLSVLDSKDIEVFYGVIIIRHWKCQNCHEILVYQVDIDKGGYMMTPKQYQEFLNNNPWLVKAHG
jgi:hypothetical protein